MLNGLGTRGVLVVRPWPSTSSRGGWMARLPPKILATRFKSVREKPPVQN